MAGEHGTSPMYITREWRETQVVHPVCIFLSPTHLQLTATWTKSAEDTAERHPAAPGMSARQPWAVGSGGH